MVIKATDGGSVVRLRDVARIELGAQSYSTRGYLGKRLAVGLSIDQRPGTNALATAGKLQATIKKLAQISAGAHLRDRLQPYRVCAGLGRRGHYHHLRSGGTGDTGCYPVPPEPAYCPDPYTGHTGVLVGTFAVMAAFVQPGIT